MTGRPTYRIACLVYYAYKYVRESLVVPPKILGVSGYSYCCLKYTHVHTYFVDFNAASLSPFILYSGYRGEMEPFSLYFFTYALNKTPELNNNCPK
jgi:hypothetical protein